MKLKVFFLIILNLFFQNVKLQFTNTLYNFNSHLIFKSPQVSALEKYIDFPIDEKRGIINISIPIFTIELNNFKLPITIDYITEGIKPDQISSNVGLGWTLRAGGAISRTVRGLYEDEAPFGIYSTQCKYLSPSDYQNANCFIIWISGTCDIVRSGNDAIVDHYDAEPDIFYFNVNDISGKFIFDCSRNIKLIHEQDVKISVEYEYYEFKKWQIISPDGTKYIFKDYETSHTEYYDPEALSLAITPKIKTAWLLDKIITINLDTINFFYAKDEIISDTNWSPQKEKLYNNHREGCPGGGRIRIIQNNLRLEKIETPISIIFFNYSQNKREDIYKSLNYGSKALQEIIIKDKLTNTEIKKYKFITSYFGDDSSYYYKYEFGSVPSYYYKRLRLDEIQEIQNNVINKAFKFYYNKNNPYDRLVIPARLSKAKDFYGYYNGHDENLSLLPTIGNREVNTTTKVIFILDEIKYPTGGVAKFFYESDSTSGLIFDYSTLTYKYYNKIPAGGLRIKKIIYDSNDGNSPIEKTYYYDIGKFTKGIPNFYNRGNYDHMTKLWCYNGDCYDKKEYTYILSEPFNSENNFLYHNSVTIKEKGKGSITYSFSYIPDFDFLGIDPTWYEEYPSIDIVPIFINKTQEIIKDDVGNVIKYINYNYKTYYNQIIDPKTWQFCRVSYDDYTRLFFYPYYAGYNYLKEKIEITLLDNKNLINSEKYYYSSLSFIDSINEDIRVFKNLTKPYHHLINKTVITKSDGNKIVISNTYPNDYSPASTGFVKDMINANIINKPIETVTYLINKDNNIQILNGKIITYKTGLQLGLPDELYLLETNNPINLNNFKFSNQFYPGYLPGEGPISPFLLPYIDTRYVKKESYQYDNHGNIIQIQKNFDIPNSYYWSYNNSYPIIEAKNVSYDILEQKVNQAKQQAGITDFNEITEPSKDSNQRTKWLNFNKYLRSLLGDAMITTYTYKPLIGMTSITDENGKTTYYEYDSFGQLQYIKDQDLNIIKEYKYHYKK